jgi:hypothetical protein
MHGLQNVHSLLLLDMHVYLLVIVKLKISETTEEGVLRLLQIEIFRKWRQENEQHNLLHDAK